MRVIGPGVSWSAEIGMTPYRLTRPTVGLMPTSMFWFDGLRIEPDVSVPTFAEPEAHLGAGSGARAAGAEDRASVEEGVARVATRVVRVETVARERVVVGRHA